MKLTIGKKIIALLLFMLLITVINILLIYRYQHLRKHDAHIVNLAGRQRMLAQKIAKLAFSVASGNDSAREQLSEAIRLYDTSLKVLQDGGDMMGGNIPPAPTMMKDLFNKNQALWDVFRKKAEIVVKERRDNPSFSEAISYIKGNNETLLKESDEVVMAYDTLPHAQEYAHEINLAGRQRMLSQKMTKYALSIATGEDGDRQKLQQAIELYDKSFLTMRDGGASIPWGRKIKVPPPSVGNALNLLEGTWYQFKAKVRTTQEEPRNNRVFREAIDYIRLNGDELLRVSDKATYNFDQIFSKKVNQLRTLLIVMLGFDIFIFLIGCFMANNISKPIGNLSKAAMKIGAGDFAQKIAIPNSRDEVRDLANAFDKMIKDLEKTTVSKDYLDNIIESTLDCIVISKKGYIFMVNSAFAQTLGYNKEELKGKAMLEFMPIKEGTYTSTTGELVQIDKNYCDDLMRTYDQLFEEGKVSNKETFFIGKDQKVIPVETNIALLYNKDRALTGVVRSIRDLTVRKMAENKLRAYNDFVENILRTCPDGIMVINNGYILTVNSGVEKMLGYTQKELIGDHIKILAPQDEMSESVTELHTKINETGFLKNQELLWRRKDGSLLPVESHFTRLNDRNGNVLGTLIITRDITERKQAEEALSRAHDELERKVEVRTAELTESNEQLNLEITERKQIEVKLKNTTEQLSILLESLPIIPYICKAGRDFVLTYIGNRVEEITGYKVNQCIEDSSFWVKHIHPDDQDRVGSAFQELYKCGENNYQYRFRVADGSYKWFNNIQRLIKLPDGTVSHITGSLQDITEGKRLRQESEHRLQQIIQSDKLASLGKIVAGVAHEINNPNSFVIYNLPLLEETWEVVEPILTDYARTHPGWEVNGVCLDELSQDMKEIIDAIRSGSKRINSVVTNLKDYVRLHEALDFIPVQVNDVVKKALTMVESQIERYGSKRVLKLAGTLPEIPGYFHKLEQVLVNLLVNATDAVATKDDGKISITTRYLVRLATVLIEIEDNGEGMEPLTIDRIFEPFFTTRLGTGGTGLGLSVSHSLVKEHNGNIGVLSQKGVGSRLTVFLPVSRETELKIYPSILCLNYDVEFIDELRISSGEYVDGFLQALSKPDSLISYLEEHPEVDIVLFNSMILDAHSDLKLLEEIKKRFPLLTVIMCSDPQTVLNKKKGTAQPDYLLKKPFKMNELLEIINTIGRQRL